MCKVTVSHAVKQSLQLTPFSVYLSCRNDSGNVNVFKLADRYSAYVSTLERQK